jgi:hypothetical protein
LNTVEELADYISSKLEGEYDYNTHIEAIADITKAAFDSAANKLGASGYSASCAELMFLQKSRKINGPFCILRAEDMLYPQYNLPDSLTKFIEQWQPFLKEEACKMLADHGDYASPQVFQHWKDLADGN